jgi:F-type H+-transporting ATPase subunit gamma
MAETPRRWSARRSAELPDLWSAIERGDPLTDEQREAVATPARAPGSRPPSEGPMQTPEAIKRRLETAEDLRSIVRTMKALAAVSIRQYEEAVASLAEYARMVDLGLQALLRERPEALPAMPREPARRPGIIVLGSDQGLCGAFNEHIAAFYPRVARGGNGDPAHGPPVLAVGASCRRRLEDAGVPPATVLTLPVSAALVARWCRTCSARIDAWRAPAA